MPQTMDAKSSKPFDIAKLLFHWMGIWSHQATKKFKLIRVISQTVLIAYFFSTIYPMPKGLIYGNLTFKATHVSIGIISILGGYDIVILGYRRKFKNFMANVIENEKFLNNNPNESLRKIHQDSVKLFWPTFMFQLNFVNISITLTWYAHSLIMFTWRQLEHEKECRNADDCSMLMIETWYCPFQVDTYYWWGNFVQLSCGSISALLNFARDLYFSNFICYIRCRLRILTYVLHNFDEFVQKKPDEDGYSEEIDELLKCCVKEHQIIISEFQELKSMISWLLFLMVTLNVPIVLFGVLLVFKSDQFIQFLAAVLYTSSYAVSHLFMILWQADNLSSESEKVADEIYDSSWYKLSTDQQKVLLIMMTRAQKPFILNCGFLCFASVNTFVKTIKTVYSFLNAVIKMSS